MQELRASDHLSAHTIRRYAPVESAIHYGSQKDSSKTGSNIMPGANEQLKFSNDGFMRMCLRHATSVFGPVNLQGCPYHNSCLW